MNWYQKKDYSEYPSQEWIRETVKKIKRCEKCTKPLDKLRATHINVKQDHPVHAFCNNDCKLKWIFRK